MSNNYRVIFKDNSYSVQQWGVLYNIKGRVKHDWRYIIRGLSSEELALEVARDLIKSQEIVEINL